ncbi:Chalcone isomerase [Kalmanozyma brasiliensis GHG001]|uniref:Chalcone isomerase domain-containing protein n=1 Tax=Kalmanozyma brasiliensis (strain GHG001) TaxID=1365824 RepID=V5E4Q2_KALBG|nr:Chalcone isomerase [Kalmanozyma brasiliensis GHG001]EST05176.1 Chalcone isomerase [Kalmanozyma brasiliensis GHG001]
MIAGRTSIALAGSRRLLASSTTARRSVATFTRSYPAFPPSSSADAVQRPTFFQQSFHPSIAASIYVNSTQAESRRWAPLLAAAALAGIVTVYNLSSPVHLDAAPPTASNLPSPPADASTQVLDPDTGLSFSQYLATPATLSSTTAAPRLKLAGLGVRTVSFLSVRVYVAALYIDESHPSPPMPASGSLEEHMRTLLDAGVPVIIRIVPVRNTDFNHLRDGFVRALQARLKKALKSESVPREVEVQFEEDIRGVKESMPKGSVPKGSALDVVIAPMEKGKPSRMGLTFEYEGQTYGGKVESNVAKLEDKYQGFTVGRELVLAYFADKGEISPKFKRSVEQGLLGSQPEA